MKKFAKHAFSAVALLLFITGGIIWLSGGFGHRIASTEVAPPSVTVPDDAKTAKVALVSEPAIEWSSGSLQSASRTAISARILARIEEVRVSAGDRVERGDVLVTLDSRDLVARTKQARDDLNAAKAKLELAKKEQDRAATLLERGVGTQQRYDNAVTGLRVASAELDGAVTGLEAAETALSHAVIKAPVGGRVIDRLADPGDTAEPGKPLLRVYDPAQLRVEAPVRETLAVRLKVGQNLSVRVAAVEKQFDGVIDEIVPFAETGARTLLVKVALEANQGLYAGLFARLAIPAGQLTRLYIPTSAVENIGQLSFVTVVDENNRASRRLITLGQSREDNRVEILSGVKEGEMVLINR